MYRILTASSDCYLTNKIINNSFRATDANTGQAGTLDLFKLYDESTLSGSSTPIELSRILLKFDLDPLRQLTGSILNLNSFKAELKLFDVYGGQTVPTNFTMSILPLSKSFDEGFGRDIATFKDLDVSNWLTASEVSGVVPWSTAGAGSVGPLGSSTADVMDIGDLGAGSVSLESTQAFSSGEENLTVDVTTVVSATLAGILPDHGLRLSFTGSQEEDTQTRFVKRFYSRHSTSKNKTPRLIVSFDDSIQDDHENFFFDLTGSIFLNNYARGVPANIVSGSALSEVSGQNCMLVTLTSGSFSTTVTASQYTVGGNSIPGVYSASFAIPSNNSLLVTEIRNAASATFAEVWGSLDGTVPFLTSSLVIKSITPTAFNRSTRRMTISVTNDKETYQKTEKPRFRVFAFDYDEADDFKVFRLPFEQKSVIFRNMHYQIRDFHTKEVVIPFDTTNNSTRMSTDSEGMYFETFLDFFPPGRVYEINVLVRERGIDQIFEDLGAQFRVEP